MSLFSFITNINGLFEVSTPSASHVVEMESVICLYFRSTLLTSSLTDWNFLTKFCSSDPSFNKNILTSFCACATTLLLVYTCYIQISQHGVSWKLTLRILLTNNIMRQRYECDHLTFLRNTLRCAPSYQK